MQDQNQISKGLADLISGGTFQKNRTPQQNKNDDESQSRDQILYVEIFG